MKDHFFSDRNLLHPPVARAAYSDRMAWLLAECSRLAYIPFEKHETTLGLTLLEGDLQLSKTFNSSGTQAFLATRANFAVLAFRGTEPNGQDILTDLKLKLTRTPKGLLHEGFYQAYKHVAESIRDAVDGLGDLPLYVTGHSLGGALATIAAHELERDSLAACYTFGSPRVGTEKLDRHIKAPTYRVVNSADIVPRVPLLTMNYDHVGSLHYLTKNSIMKRSPNGFSTGGYFAKHLALKFNTLLADHSIEEYVRKLAKFAQSRNPQEVPTEKPATKPDLKVVPNTRVS